MLRVCDDVRRAFVLELDGDASFVASIGPAVLHRSALLRDCRCYVRIEVDVQHSGMVIAEREPSRRHAREPAARRREPADDRRATGRCRVAPASRPASASVRVSRANVATSSALPVPAAHAGSRLKSPPATTSGSARASASVGERVGLLGAALGVEDVEVRRDRRRAHAVADVEARQHHVAVGRAERVLLERRRAARAHQHRGAADRRRSCSAIAPANGPRARDSARDDARRAAARRPAPAGARRRRSSSSSTRATARHVGVVEAIVVRAASRAARRSRSRRAAALMC